MNFDRAFNNILTQEAFATKTLNSKLLGVIEFREATQKDVNELIRYYTLMWKESTWLQPENEATFIRNLKKNITSPWTNSATKYATLQIALEGSRIVGCMAIREIIEGVKYLRISSLSVLFAYQGRGIASKLIRIAEQIAKDRKDDALSLGCKADNKHALDLYLRQGFKPFHLQLERKIKP